MTGQHVTCTDCGTRVKQSIAAESDGWKETADGWVCPHDNPDSDASW